MSHIRLSDVLHMGLKPHIHECDIFLQYMTPYVLCASVGGHHAHRRGRTSRLAGTVALVRLCGVQEAWQGSPLPQLCTCDTMRMQTQANACDAEPSHCSQLAARARQRPPLLRGDAVRHAGHGHSRIRHLRSKAVTWCEIAWVNCVRTYGSSPRLRASAQ